MNDGQRVILLRQADLEMVARLALVQEQRRLLPRAARRQIVGVEIEGAGARAVGRALLIAAAGLELLAEGRIGRISSGVLGTSEKKLRNLRLDPLLPIA